MAAGEQVLALRARRGRVADAAGWRRGPGRDAPVIGSGEGDGEQVVEAAGDYGLDGVEHEPREGIAGERPDRRAVSSRRWARRPFEEGSESNTSCGLESIPRQVANTDADKNFTCGEIREPTREGALNAIRIGAKNNSMRQTR